MMRKDNPDLRSMDSDMDKKKAACVLRKVQREKDKPLNDERIIDFLIIIKRKIGKLLLKEEERYERRNRKQC